MCGFAYCIYVCMCIVSLPLRAMGWYVTGDCCIFWPYFLTLCAIYVKALGHLLCLILKYNT